MWKLKWCMCCSGWIFQGERHTAFKVELFPYFFSLFASWLCFCFVCCSPWGGLFLDRRAISLSVILNTVFFFVALNTFYSKLSKADWSTNSSAMWCFFFSIKLNKLHIRLSCGLYLIASLVRRQHEPRAELLVRSVSVVPHVNVNRSLGEEGWL